MRPNGCGMNFQINIAAQLIPRLSFSQKDEINIPHLLIKNIQTIKG